MPRIRVIEIQSEEDAREHLAQVGVSRPGQKIMSRKAMHRVLKVESLGAVALSVLKQEMLSIGAEAGISANAYYLKGDVGQALLMGTLVDYEQLIQKLHRQPSSLGLRALAEEISGVLHCYDAPRNEWHIGNQILPLHRPPYLVGVLPLLRLPSFDQRGHLIETARQMVQNGAEIIEIEYNDKMLCGTVTCEDENGLGVLIRSIKDETGAMVAVATGEPLVATMAIRVGAEIIDESTSDQHEYLSSIVAKAKAGMILRPSRGDLVPDRLDALGELVEEARAQGVDERCMTVDPFAIDDVNKIDVLKALSEFRILGLPLVATIPFGVAEQESSSVKIAASIGAWMARGVAAGISVVRVRDVVAAAAALESLT